MYIIKKVLLLLAAVMVLSFKAQVPCNSINSPTFQLITSTVSQAVNGFCYVQINIINANTSPIGGGAVSFCILAPGSPNCAQPPVMAIAVGVWTVMVKDNSNACVTTQTVQVTTLPEPSVSVVASNTLVCAEDMVTITASGAATYVWNTNATTATFSAAPTTSFIYSVTGTSSNGCSNTASVAVNVKPLPNVTASPIQVSLCLNQSIQLAAQGANSYTWNNSVTGSQYTTSAITSTGIASYNVLLKGTGNTGCVGTKTISGTVWVNACENSVGITEYTNSSQKIIYPNPAHDILNIVFHDNNRDINTEIKIVDVLGKEMLSVKKTKQINVSELPKGVYFIKFGNEVRSFLKE